MGFSYEILEQQLTDIQNLKSQIIAKGLSGIQQPDSWRVGEVQFSKGGGGKAWLNLKDLLDMEKQLMEMMRTMFPTEHVVTHQDAIDGFGRDMTSYANEETI